MSDVLKSKHGFGKSDGVSAAIADGKLDAYDILFLDSDTSPKIGWIDKNGNPIIMEGKEQVIKVDELPVADGDESVIYLYNHEAYVWDGTQCVSISKSADVSQFEQDVATLKTQMANKVDSTEVQTMIDTKVEAAVEETVKNAVEEAIGSEVVEF